MRERDKEIRGDDDSGPLFQKDNSLTLQAHAMLEVLAAAPTLLGHSIVALRSLGGLGGLGGLAAATGVGGLAGSLVGRHSYILFRRELCSWTDNYRVDTV